MSENKALTLMDMIQGEKEMESSNILNQEYGKVLVTTDYDMFKKVEGNRPIDERNYRKLLASMAKKQLMSPIVVNEHMEIIDGQHRFKAERELGLPVYYMIIPGYSIDEVKSLNLISSNWKMHDYMNMHLTRENDHYMRLNELVTDSKLTLGDVIKIFSVANGRSLNVEREIFNSGEYCGEGYEKVSGFVEAIKDFEFYKGYNSRNFVAAFITLYFFPTYDHSVMQYRLNSRKHVLNTCDLKTKNGYLKELATNIYSFGANKNLIYFDRDRQKLYTR